VDGDAVMAGPLNGHRPHAVHVRVVLGQYVDGAGPNINYALATCWRLATERTLS